MDAVVAWRLWPILHEQLHQKDRVAAYELQRRAIPAVVAMELRGLGFDPVEHAKQTAVWAGDLAQARHEYQAATGVGQKNGIWDFDPDRINDIADAIGAKKLASTAKRTASV
jgi:hypothetical protein